MCKLVRILKVKKMQICKKIKVNFRKKNNNCIWDIL